MGGVESVGWIFGLYFSTCLARISYFGQHSLSWCAFPCDYRRQGVTPLASYSDQGSDSLRLAMVNALLWTGFLTVTQLQFAHRLVEKIPEERGVASTFSHIPFLHLLTRRKKRTSWKNIPNGFYTIFGR